MQDYDFVEQDHEGTTSKQNECPRIYDLITNPRVVVERYLEKDGVSSQERKPLLFPEEK